MISKLSLAVLMSTTVAVGAHGPVQSQESFEAAIRNHSSAPSFVLISVVDDRSRAERTTCTFANFLIGAIHREHGLGYEEAERIAVRSRTHAFHFSKSEALANIPFTFSESDLAAVRSQLAGLPIEQLRHGFSGTGDLHAIYRVQPRARHEALRDATACVLIERGLSPGIGDRSDQLWLAP